MFRFVKKHPVWFALLLLVVGPASLNISGFCWSKLGWLSDEEQIKLAVEYVNRHGPNINYLPDSDWDTFRAYEHIPYKDVETFMKENPGCCETIGFSPKKWFKTPFSLRISGHKADVVKLHYTLRFHDPRTERAIEVKDFTEYASIRNCTTRSSGQVYTTDLP